MCTPIYHLFLNVIRRFLNKVSFSSAKTNLGELINRECIRNETTRSKDLSSMCLRRTLISATCSCVETVSGKWSRAFPFLASFDKCVQVVPKSCIPFPNLPLTIWKKNNLIGPKAANYHYICLRLRPSQVSRPCIFSSLQNTKSENV